MSLDIIKDSFYSGNYKLCLKLLKKHKSELNEEEYFYFKVKSLFFLRKSNKAIRVVNKAIKKNSVKIDYYFFKLEIYIYNYKNKIKEIKNIIETIEGISNSSETNRLITHYIGILEFRKSNFVNAEKMFETSLSLDFGSSTTFTAENTFLLGCCYYKNYDYKRLNIIINRYSFSKSKAISNHIKLLKMIYAGSIDKVYFEELIVWARSNVYHNFFISLSITQNIDLYGFISKNKNIKKLRKGFKPYKLGYL